LERGEKIVSVGGSTEKTFIPCTIDARFKTTPRQTAWIMKNSKFFIGIDSFPMHIAQSFNIPGIAFFGSVSPNLILYSKKMKSITANNLTCLGCHHNQSLFASKTTHKCKTNTLDCINKVSVEDMWNKIIELLDEGKNENHCILG
jgi:ADP-heptose:LPS heptosyltransferase